MRPVPFSGMERSTVKSPLTTDRSPFVNAAFISLLENYSYDFIRTHLTIADATKQIADMIKRRFAFELNRPPGKGDALTFLLGLNFPTSNSWQSCP